MTKATRIWIGALIGVLTGGAARAEGPVSTAQVLGQIHHANQREVLMGRLAQDHGLSKDVMNFGKVLAKDHAAADKKVVKLAKDEKLDLAANTPPPDTHTDQVHTGTAFDDAFVTEMLAAHKKDIAAVTAARNSTPDPKLKRLLTNLLPVLKKHLDMAQTLVDQSAKHGT